VHELSITIFIHSFYICLIHCDVQVKSLSDMENTFVCRFDSYWGQMCFKYAKFRIERVNPFVWLVDTNNCSKHRKENECDTLFPTQNGLFLSYFFFSLGTFWQLILPSHVPVLNFEEKNGVIQNALIFLCLAGISNFVVCKLYFN
jgi:hypothetical protein